MLHSPLRLRVSSRPVLALILGVAASFAPAYADGAAYYSSRQLAKPAVSAPDSLAEDSELDTLGGPAIARPKGKKFDAPKIKTNVYAVTNPGPLKRVSDDNKPAPGNPIVPSVTYAGATADAKPDDTAQPPAAFGPTPFDLGRIRTMQIGNNAVPDAPMRVGNLDILAPIVDYVSPLGISVTQADPNNVPTLFNTSPRDFFQINLPTGSPIVLAVNRATAWGKDEKGQPFETPLRSAPLVINQKLFLPIFSIAPLVGAASRLNPDGTLVLMPTIESVQLFPVANTVAVTIKSSAPIPPGAFKINSLPGDARSAPRIYIDFNGFSMGFDAGNSTSIRLVANGVGDVIGVRAGQTSTIPAPESTRVTFDLKKQLTGSTMRIESDPTLFAMVLAEPGAKTMADTPNPFDPPVNGGGPAIDGPAVGDPVIFTPPTPQGSQPLKGISIVIDAGHGGKDTGAKGVRSLEKQHTLALATKLASHLRARGATVHMTRIGDTYPSLSDRVNFANSRRADLFISIHMNASVNKGSRGTETFFYTGQSRNFANSVHSEFSKATGRPNRGISQARFYVIKNTTMPSLLLECAFVSNPTEESIAMSDAWREKVARGIAQGVVNYDVRFPIRRSGLSG